VPQAQAERATMSTLRDLGKRPAPSWVVGLLLIGSMALYVHARPAPSPAGGASAPAAAPAAGAVPAGQPSPQSTPAPAQPASGAASGHGASAAAARGNTTPAAPTEVAEKDIPLRLDAPAADPGKPRGAGGLVGWLLGLGVKLGVVLLLAYGCLLALRRFMPGGVAAAPASDMGVRRTITLAPGRSVHLLEVEGRHLLIASSGQQITLLAELTPSAPGPVVETEASQPHQEARRDGFRRHLDGLLGHGATAGTPGAAGVELGENPSGHGGNGHATVESADAPHAPATTVKATLGPDVLSDEELREEMRRSLLRTNRSAEGIARMRESFGEGGRTLWRAR